MLEPLQPPSWFVRRYRCGLVSIVRAWPIRGSLPGFMRLVYMSQNFIPIVHRESPMGLKHVLRACANSYARAEPF